MAEKIRSIDFNSFNQQEKVDYILLKNLVTKGEYFLNQDYTSFEEVAHVGKFSKDILPFIKARRGGKKFTYPECIV